MSEVLNNGMIFAMAKSTGWSVNGFLKNLNSSLFSWGKIIVVILGVIMVLAGLFQIGKGLMSGGRSQTNWVVAIALFFLGGALAFSGGWGLVESVAKGGAQTLNDLGTGTTATSILFDAMQMLH